MNISHTSRQVVEQIISSARTKSIKGRRYNDDWIIQCILLHIRSLKDYKYLREVGLLPLLCGKTIRRYTSLIDMKCGFDGNFLKLFKKCLLSKKPLQKHGLISFDEISLRESVSVSNSSLTYLGLCDYGDLGKKAKTVNEKAKTALVGMFQPLADSYTQPFCVFASAGPIVGVELAKIVLISVINLEKYGAKIHGVITDGAETNRRMWREFGINGSLHHTTSSCQHVVEKDRILFFSQILHI